jgi:hypothetical protein
MVCEAEERVQALGVCARLSEYVHGRAVEPMDMGVRMRMARLASCGTGVVLKGIVSQCYEGVCDG